MKKQRYTFAGRLPEEAILLRKRISYVVLWCVLVVSSKLTAQQITVWPGDANNDGIVNYLDVLPVGAAFGFQGNSRDSVSVEWREFLVDRWIDSLPNGLNGGYIDCSGNGLINIDDIFAIETNYGATNPNFNGLQFQQGNINDPQLAILPLQGPWLPGDTVRVTIYLTQKATDSVYSVAFTLYYDTSIIRENSVMLWPHPQFSGGGTQPVFVQKNFPDLGLAEFAVSRTNKRNQAGSISVAYASFIIEDNLIGKTFLDVANAFRIERIRLHDKAMKNIPARGDSMDAKISTVIPEKRLRQSIHIYPTPASERLIIDFSGDISLQQILLIDINGKTIPINYVVVENSAVIDISEIVSNIYFLKLITDKGILHEKIIIGR